MLAARGPFHLFETSEELLINSLQWVRLTVEAAGALWITIGFILAMVRLISTHVRGRTATFTAIRLTFSRYLSLGLEFELASDILSTAIAPSWQELGKLAATAVIRTALNYFLSREMREYVEREEHRVALVSEPSEYRVSAS